MGTRKYTGDHHGTTSFGGGTGVDSIELIRSQTPPAEGQFGHFEKGTNTLCIQNDTYTTGSAPKVTQNGCQPELEKIFLAGEAREADLQIAP